jgi:hypothetical protein
MNPYYLMNYLFTSNHLYDWILKDKNIKNSIIDDMKCKFKLSENNSDNRYIVNKEINQEFDIVKALCNRSKHFTKDKHDRPKEKVDGGSFDNWDFSDFSFAGHVYNVITSDGSKNVFDICEKNYKDWHEFFSKHKDYFTGIGYIKEVKEDKYHE